MPANPVLSIAIQVHDMEAMLAFYQRAFGFEFRAVRTGPFDSQFAEREGLTLKLVPMRAAKDFESFPIHQLGFAVDDVEATVALAQELGGQPLGEVVFRDGRATDAAVRDPDGNSIELTAT